jgi:hypothetical protein
LTVPKIIITDTILARPLTVKFQCISFYFILANLPSKLVAERTKQVKSKLCFLLRYLQVLRKIVIVIVVVVVDNLIFFSFLVNLITVVSCKCRNHKKEENR